MIRKLLLIFSIFYLCSSITIAQEKTEESPLKIKLIPKNEGIFPDRLLELYAEVKNTTSEEMKYTIDWEITNDEGVVLRKKAFPYKVQPNGTFWAYCPLYRFQTDGFFEVRAEVNVNGITQKFKTVVTTNPENISSPLLKPVDFDEFWKEGLEELAAIKPNFKVKKIKRNKDAKTNLFEVEMQSVGELTVRGWLEVPKKKGVYPTLIQVPGYTVNLEPVDKYEDMIIFSFNVRDHGNSDNSGKRHYKMWARGLDNPKEFYYYGIYLDCIRAVDYIMTREDVDKDRIAVWGASQGGGLAFMTAALDQRIDFCVADIPFLTDWERYFSISNWEEIDEWLMQHPTVSWNTVLNTLSYFDTKNMAKNIQCPVSMGIGLQDEVCPPSTSFATYNLITTPKTYFIDQTQGHWVSDEKWEEHYKEIRAFFKMDEI